MPSLPVPMIGALALGILLAHALARGWAARGLLVLIAASGIQLIVVALAQHWNLPLARAIQPVTAAAVPAIAWVAFLRGAVRGSAPARDLPHVAGPAAVALAVLAAPPLLGAMVPALLVGYGVAILAALRPGESGTPLARLEHGGLSARLWRLIGIALVVSAVSDLAIDAAFAMGQARAAAWIVTLTTTGFLVAIGLIALAAPLDADRREPKAPVDQETTPEDETPEHIAAQDAEIMARLNRLMEERRPHLDPDLTLARLARRLQVPAKALSAAANRVGGENVSRLVNGHRIREACRLLDAGESVTAAMLASGFATKSNFNREFLRIVGTTPSGYRAARRGE